MLAAIALTTDRSMNPGKISYRRAKKWQRLKTRFLPGYKEPTAETAAVAEFRSPYNMDKDDLITEVLSLDD